MFRMTKVEWSNDQYLMSHIYWKRAVSQRWGGYRNGEPSVKQKNSQKEPKKGLKIVCFRLGYIEMSFDVCRLRQVVRLNLYEGLSLEVPSYTDCTEVPCDIKKADIQDKKYPPLV